MEWQIRDLESRNGTWVDGQRVTEMWLRPEMSIRIGTTEFIFRIPSRRSTEKQIDESEKILCCEPVGEIEDITFSVHVMDWLTKADARCCSIRPAFIF